VIAHEGITEAAFIRRVVYMYVGLFVLALILAAWLKRLRRKHRGEAEEKGREEASSPFFPVN